MIRDLSFESPTTEQMLNPRKVEDIIHIAKWIPEIEKNSKKLKTTSDHTVYLRRTLSHESTCMLSATGLPACMLATGLPRQGSYWKFEIYFPDFSLTPIKNCNKFTDFHRFSRFCMNTARCMLATGLPGCMLATGLRWMRVCPGSTLPVYVGHRSTVPGY